MKFLDVPQSGSIAGTVHSHNRAGQYTRNRRMPVQPVGSGRRAIVRARFGAGSAAWAGLTAVEQAGWDSFAADHPVVDALGQSVVLTGHQMYVRVSASAANVGLAAPTGPIADIELPVLAAITFTFSIAAGAEIDDFTGTAGEKVAAAFSRPMSSGRRFNKTFWQPLGADGYTDGDAAPYALTSALYQAEFGLPVVGQRIFARVTPVSGAGFNGTPVIVQALVAA